MTRVNQLKAVGFDLDGTLFDHRGSASEAVNAFFCELGVEPSALARRIWFDAEEAQLEHWRAGHLSFQDQRRNRLRTVLPHLAVPVPENNSSLDLLFEKYLGAYRAAWRPFSDSVATLVALRRAGMRLGVLTNGTEQQQIDKLRITGLYDLVDVVCTSEVLKVQKPARRAFHVLAAQLGVLLEEYVFVGDNPKQDVAGARFAGMHAVLIDRYGTDREGLAAKLRTFAHVL